jgi:hypothetical protein
MLLRKWYTAPLTLRPGRKYCVIGGGVIGYFLLRWSSSALAAVGDSQEAADSGMLMQCDEGLASTSFKSDIGT